MKKRTWKIYTLWILLTEAVGLIAALLTRRGVLRYNAAVQKPLLSPPPLVFPIVWALLYALMGAGAARIYSLPASEARTKALRLYGIQLGFNFLWSILFFNFQAYGIAFLWLTALWALIVWMTLSFRTLDLPAARLQLPYLLWVAFAGYLNFGVWMLNH